MDHLNQNLIEQKHPKWIDRLARTKWCQQNDKEIFDRWQQGFDEEGMRRFLRRMMERETINGTTELDFDFACLKQSNVESRAHIDYLENELKSLKGTISHLQSNCSLLVNATSNDTDSQTTLEPKLIEKTVREILTYDFDKNINLVFSGQGEFAVSVEQAVIYPICMTISQLALETFNLPKSDAAVSCQCKHKLTKDTHYFVVLLKPKIPCNVKQNSFEENMSLIERLLSPVRIKSQIIDIDRTRLVMSFSWSEKLKNNEKSKQRRSTAELNL